MIHPETSDDIVVIVVIMFERMWRSVEKLPIHPEAGCKEGEGKVPAHKSLQQFKALKHLWQKNISFYRTQVYLGSDLWVQVSLSD